MKNMVAKQIRIPINLSEKGFVGIVVIAAVQTIILTAIKKKYSIEIDGEVTEGSLKGSMKLHPICS